MNVLIIEDEEPASARLAKMLTDIANDAQVVGVIESVKAGLAWFENHPSPDLILADIQLADGISMELLSAAQIDCPVIFTTAFDEYAISAFKHNSIDYLLKPIRKEELGNSLEKFRKLSKSSTSVDYTGLLQIIQNKQEQYQKRMLIRYRDQLIMVNVEEIAYFYVEHKITYITTRNNDQYQVDYTMDECENLLDPAVFFRINRQCIVHITAIKKMVAYSKSRVGLSLHPDCPFETIVSTERSGPFKVWLLGK